MMTVCILLLPMEPRWAPLGRPTLMGPIGNLVIWLSGTHGYVLPRVAVYV
jgi:hypothetical protein